MADNPQKPTQDRRTFLKIGAGVVAGAAIASVVEIPYYGSVIGGNSSSSSSSVSALQGQLSSTQDQLTSTAAQLSAAQGQVSSLNTQLSSTAAQLNSANSQLSGVSTQLSSTQQALTSANGQISTLGGQVTSLNGQVTSLSGQVSSLNSAVTSANSQVSSLQTEVSTLTQLTAFQFFTPAEQNEVEAMAETMIPSDSTGPGAKEAGVIYFVDGQLASEYGNNANMYLQGPYVQPGKAGPITVGGTTYSGGSAPARLTAGGGFQYPLKWQEFWRNCLQWTEDYSKSAYGGSFETLSAANRAACLTDLWNNKPTNFLGITPQAWFSELHDMIWAGFFTDPLYGGNRGMVGWLLTAFSGTNQGNAYGEGYSTKQLMVMTKPVRLQPQSLAQFQQQEGELLSGGA